MKFLFAFAVGFAVAVGGMSALHKRDRAAFEARMGQLERAKVQAVQAAKAQAREFGRE